MKRLKQIFLLGVALLVAACAKESIKDDASEVLYTFTISQDDVASTKADFSDGTTATYLAYGVYNSSNELISALSNNGQEAAWNNLTTTVTLSLAKGNTYTIAFWAYSNDGPYSVDFKNGEVTYSSDATITSNCEDYDAFYNTYSTGEVTSNESVSVTLNRPFAQLNFGTSDLQKFFTAAEEENLKTKVTVENGYSGFNLLTGKGTASEEMITYDYDEYPSGQTFPYSSDDVSYSYVSMNYLFTDDSQSNVDVVLYFSTDGKDVESQSVEVSAVPIQRNYRTNIYGALLTGTYTIDVTKDKTYEGEINQEWTPVATASGLKEALESEEDANIQLTEDISLGTTTVTVSSDKTIDLNGNTLTSESTTTRNIIVSSGSTLTITDSGDDGEATNTVSSSYGLFDVYGGLVIEGGTYTDTGSNNGALIKAREGSTLSITGGTFSCSSETAASGTYGNRIIFATSCAVSITGGTYEVNENGWVGFYFENCYGTDTDEVEISNIKLTTVNTIAMEFCATDAVISNCEVILTDKETNSYYSTAIAVDNQSKVTVESGTYTAPYAVYIFNTGGYAYLKGGTYTGTTAVLKADADTYNNQCEDREEGSYIYVTGGYYTGSYSIAASGTYTTLLSISGGYFSVDPSSYVAEGSEKSDNTDSSTSTDYPYVVK